MNNHMPLHTISGVVLLKKDGSALMQHRDDKPGLPYRNLWVFPGGHADEGEDPLTAARRELLEESAYNAQELKYLDIVEYELNQEIYMLTTYWALYDGVQKIECLEGQDLRFIRYEESKNIEIPHMLRPLWAKAITHMQAHYKLHSA